MKRFPLIAVFLIVLGIAALVYEGIAGAPGRTVSTIGPLDATVQEPYSILPPPFLGVLAVAGGIAFLIASRASGTN